MATTRVPVIAEALHQRLQVAAIDFGTTYSGYAFSFRDDFLNDPLKILTNNWITSGSTATVSLKTPSCILFDPTQKFDSFGFDAETKYAQLAAEEQHFDWFYFSRFKMRLYEHKNIRRGMQLEDDKRLKMPAMKVFSESIRFLKDHLITTCGDARLKPDEVHWILTVPAIWEDSAKQFMREAAIEAGIETKNLSLALEPEAASLFCRYTAINMVRNEDGTAQLESMKPGKRYLVLDAGGGTVDITVHETLADGTVRELYKANGGPWGGTKIDEAFLSFLIDIVGEETINRIKRDSTEDYLGLFRDFEIKKKTFGAELQARMKITFKIPSCVHDAYREITGQDFRKSLLMKQDLQGQITFTGDKLRVQPGQVERLFEETCNKIVEHLKTIFRKPEVAGTDAILMVGGFSESMMLQNYIRRNFSDKTIIIPESAGLAVLKGAAIFGHNPKAIYSRVSKHTYGISVYDTFIPGVHPDSKKVFLDGVAKCDGCFDIHVTEGQEVRVGEVFGEKSYWPAEKATTRINLRVYTSTKRNPVYTDEPECSYLGNLLVDMAHIESHSDRNILVKMIYGDTELGVEAKVVKTGEVLNAKLNFLG